MTSRLSWLVVASSWLLLGSSHPSRAQGLRGAQLDSLVTQAMQAFNVPGVALAIVENGQVVCAKGYGVRVAGQRAAVDATTLFAIASNSKAFTAAALGLLVDEGKLGWDDKLIDHLPEFRLYDPYVTADFTIRDLLTHRSGLGLGAGHLMRSPDSTQFTLPQIVYNLRYLKPSSPVSQPLCLRQHPVPRRGRAGGPGERAKLAAVRGAAPAGSAADARQSGLVCAPQPPP